jgi:hypothetical protein
MREINFLSLSTAHLSEATVSFLAVTDCMDWPALGGPYRDVGWVFHVDGDAGGANDQSPFQDLYAAFRFAAARGYDIVLFYDIEAPIDELPVYRDLETEYDVLYEGSREWQAAQQKALARSSGSNALTHAETLLTQMSALASEAHFDIMALSRNTDRTGSEAELHRLEQLVDALDIQMSGFRTMLAYFSECVTMA